MPLSQRYQRFFASTRGQIITLLRRSSRTVDELALALDLSDWGIIGPAPAFFHRQRNRFRWHLLLRAANPAPLLEALRLPPGWALDIDPVHVL